MTGRSLRIMKYLSKRNRCPKYFYAKWVSGGSN